LLGTLGARTALAFGWEEDFPVVSDGWSCPPPPLVPAMDQIISMTTKQTTTIGKMIA
jgi:hypothetical protein